MPTVDLISPGGTFTPAANGDTQDRTLPFAISSGSATLTCTAAPFVSSDTGRIFSLDGAGNQGGGDGLWLFGTMTYVSSNQVTLSSCALTTLTSTQTSRMIWGTDDAPAFRACNTWARSQTSPITVTLGSGNHNFLIGTLDPGTGPDQFRGNSLAYSLTQPITVNGNGSTNSIIYSGGGAGFFLGHKITIKTGFYSVFGSSVVWTARLNSVSSGSMTVTCKNIADVDQFTSSTWNMITGIDTQGYGYPINPYYFEHVFITNISTSTGTITFSAPLNNTYLDSWPVYSSGFPGTALDYGGPATLYAMDQYWGLVNATYQNLGLDGTTQGQIYPTGRTIQFTNVVSYGLSPTEEGTITLTNCIENVGMEYDKTIDLAIIDNTKTAQITFQSANNQVIIRNGSSVSSINCFPRNLNISNSVIGNCAVGPFGYGSKLDQFVCNNVTFSSSQMSWHYSPASYSGFVTPPLTMNRNVISIPSSIGPQGWVIPGNIIYFTGNGTGVAFNSFPYFKVISFARNATTNAVDVVTDWPYNGFPSAVTDATASESSINTIPMQYISLINSSAVWGEFANAAIPGSNAGYHVPQTFCSFTLNGGNMFSYPSYPLLNGRLVYLKYEVTTPYTGTQPLLRMEHDFTPINPDLVTYSHFWYVFLDLRTAGTRIITPSGVTGAVGADSIPPIPYQNAWIPQGPGGNTNVNITAEYNANNAVGPVFTVTMLVDPNPVVVGSPGSVSVRELMNVA